MVVLAVLLLVALPLIGGCGDDGGGLTEAEEHFNKALDYVGEGRFDDAIAQFSKAIELNPNLVEAHYNRGIAYGHPGNFEQAIGAFDQAIRLDPQDAEAYYNWGALHTFCWDSTSRPLETSMRPSALTPRMPQPTLTGQSLTRRWAETRKPSGILRKRSSWALKLTL
jgi:tetratricopeptide (TPR) repeat protein